MEHLADMTADLIDLFKELGYHDASGGRGGCVAVLWRSAGSRSCSNSMLVVLQLAGDAARQHVRKALPACCRCHCFTVISFAAAVGHALEGNLHLVFAQARQQTTAAAASVRPVLTCSSSCAAPACTMLVS